MSLISAGSISLDSTFKVNEQCETSVEYELGDILHLDSPALQRLHQVTNLFFIFTGWVVGAFLRKEMNWLILSLFCQ
jgi:hypothetical protein